MEVTVIGIPHQKQTTQTWKLRYIKQSSLGKMVTLLSIGRQALRVMHHRTAAIGAYPEFQTLGMKFSRLIFCQETSKSGQSERNSPYQGEPRAFVAP
ncbi:hypothetical protein DCAR_0625618 [Daucus carota subsp. sativus]|uniref:Uncharacterized protein n=1 Tax=Daucus carota subsp. sativus TaxID=79200 RepID=A0A164WKI9_DAUCS|nr:hypothetical protein DCAR_0625618 [Daucus carota subsp. sativus]